MAWYPGSESRADAFKHAGAGAEELGQPLQNGHSASAPSTYIPWLFRAGLSPAEVAPLCPVLGNHSLAVKASPCAYWGSH